MNLKLIISVVIFSATVTLFAQEQKEKVIDAINSWYEQHPNTYSIFINGNDGFAKETRYHPERIDEKNNLIEISYKGMKITLAFDKPFDSISTYKDSLNTHFKYVAISKIYNDISSIGWDIHPLTPSSSMRGKGVLFTGGGDALSLVINWSTYTIMGYKNIKKCNEEMNMMDMGISESCFVAVNKVLPLEIRINNMLISSD